MFLLLNQDLFDLAEDLVFILESFVSATAELSLHFIKSLLKALDILQAKFLPDNISSRSSVQKAMFMVNGPLLNKTLNG